MITRRIVANLIAFVVLSGALVAYGFLDLLGNPLASTTTVSAILPTAAGLGPNFTVTLDGVDVGSVSSVSLAPGGAKVTMTIDAGTKVPGDVTAKIVVANALGQQEIELVPDHVGPAPLLHSGAVIAANADSTPANVGVVVAEATKLLQAIPAGDLNSLLSELAQGLNGNGANLRTIASASEVFSQEFLQYQQAFESLLANAPPVLDTVAQNSTQLQQGLLDTAVLVKVLAQKSPALANLLNSGTTAAVDLNDLLAGNKANLACLTHDLADVNANLAQPANLADLSTVLATSHYLFDAVAGVAPEGPAKALTSGDHARTTQEWLRTRLLLPPGNPPGDSYVQATPLPPVLPGAACSTEFGNGVGAGVQANFRPVGPGAHVVAPTASQAHVRGSGAVTSGSTAGSANSAAVLPATARGAPAIPLIVGLFVLGWAVTARRRNGSARSARPVRVGVARTTRRNR
ncbi:MAG: MCE family protein [Acidimicrobiales bacterium]